jgi:hypothetical protein
VKGLLSRNNYELLPGRQKSYRYVSIGDKKHVSGCKHRFFNNAGQTCAGTNCGNYMQDAPGIIRVPVYVL